jgi:predicted  nucleic acid-binding Zn-ribbon protein
MERNNDELLADIVIKLVAIESQILEGQKFMEKLNNRIDFTVKRMVKAESRLDDTDKRMVSLDKRMAAFDKKLEQSLKDQREFSQMQSKLNKYFLDRIKKSNGKH